MGSVQRTPQMVVVDKDAVVPRDTSEATQGASVEMGEYVECDLVGQQTENVDFELWHDEVGDEGELLLRTVADKTPEEDVLRTDTQPSVLPD